MQEQLKLFYVVPVNISSNQFCKILQNCDMPPPPKDSHEFRIVVVPQFKYEYQKKTNCIKLLE
jgi:hypothetical protein